MTTHRRTLLTLLGLALGALVLVLACGGGISATPPPEGAIGQPCLPDLRCNDGLACVGNVCVGQDAGADSSVADAGGSGGLDDLSKWSTFNLLPVIASTHYSGAAFDGRYLYFAPDPGGGGVTRYDTQADFSVDTSWAVFDTSKLNPMARGFAGATFDGRYVYFVPNDDGAILSDAGPYDGLVVRYDTQADFQTTASWTTFDAMTLSSSAKAFVGATFDGRYLYLVPDGDLMPLGLVVRYDTHADFTLSASWATFDLTTVNAAATFLAGGVFDGRYVYFVPSVGRTVARYDTQASFTLATSWSTFDVTTMSPGPETFFGGAFDGRYVYFVPNATGGAAVRYDTHAPFATASSWASFDITTVSPAARFAGAGFDGRYVYFVPFLATTLVRYDTQGSFAAGGSWDTFDIHTVDFAASSFIGAVFDGRYVYFPPTTGTLLPRFDARTPPALPPGPAHGSFY